jgi:hypothetical protein
LPERGNEALAIKLLKDAPHRLLIARGVCRIVPGNELLQAAGRHPLPQFVRRPVRLASVVQDFRLRRNHYSVPHAPHLEAENRELVEAFGRFVDYVSRVNGVAVFQEPLFAEMRNLIAKHKGAA